MKMEIPVGAPGGGSVTSIHVSVGDIVQEGDLLVILS
jgi:acetyl-CoA carboxylase biotin carboxyl carrier protein